MGVFSPVISVAGALRVNTMDHMNVYSPVIENLPARTVALNTEIDKPTISVGYVKLYHAGKEMDISAPKYTYTEVGQYEWRFYVGDILFNSQKVTVTDVIYAMSMPADVVTVAPKDLETLNLPLPNTYRVDGKAINVTSIEKGTANIHDGRYAVVTDEDGKTYTLTATVSLENHAFETSKISFSKNNMAIDLGTNKNTGNLKVAYKLYNTDGSKLLAILPLKDIEIKNYNQNEIKFTNIPTAPSVNSLEYYANISLTAPTVDSAKVGTTSFNVEAQTKVFKIQCFPYSESPDWSDEKVHTLTVEKNDEEWIVKENGVETNDYVEVNGLNIKVKKLGWYRFQFETSTLFGYQLDETVDKSSLEIEQDEEETYIRYWSNSVHIKEDEERPNFAWVAPYNADNQNAINEMNENFGDLLNDYKNYLPSEKESETNKVIVNKQQGLVLPAIFPHDNATAYDQMIISTLSISQIKDKDGDVVKNNYVYMGEENSKTYFKYDHTKRLQISFVENDASRGNENNNVKLLSEDGWYEIRVDVKENQAKYANDKLGGSAKTSISKKYYFYYDEDYSSSNSPVISEGKKFQVSDVYLWEGNTFEFKTVNVEAENTSTEKIQTDYYFVGEKGSNLTVLSQLAVGLNDTQVTIDLADLYQYQDGKNTTNKLTIDTIKTYDSFYIYAVARNFNAMQANLKQELGVTNLTNSDTFFDAEYCFGMHDEDDFAQYGYAWKRAKFNIHETDSTSNASLLVKLNDGNKYETGKTITIDTITTTWNTAVDGQMSVAVYKVKNDNVLAPVKVVNSNKPEANEVISTVAFNDITYTWSNLYFTPDSSGKYILVVNAKDFASDIITSSVTEIVIGSGTDLEDSPVRPVSVNTANTNNKEKIELGESLIIEDYEFGSNYQYSTNNGKVYEAGVKVGSYTVTVIGFGVSAPNSITGNKFTPNKVGEYILRFNCEVDGVGTKEIDVPVSVTENSNSVSSIRVGESYNAEKVLWNEAVTHDGVEADGKEKIGDQYYVIGEADTGTVNKPAYAIILEQFVMSNYGASTDFVVDSASLFQYLEPIYENGNVVGYMYPAIAIPMPNLISENFSSDKVEISVQKSNGDYLVLSNKKAGENIDSANKIANINDYYVFRPEGKFSKDIKTKYTATTYLESEPKDAAGVYTVSYKTGSANLNYNITFGNLKNGALSYEENFLTYNNDDGKGDQAINSNNNNNLVIEEIDGHRYVTIDMSKLSFNGNADMESLIEKGPNPEDNNPGYSEDQFETAYYWEKALVTVSFDGVTYIKSNAWSDDEDETTAIKITDDGKFLLKFDLNQGSGTYKVNISMPNKYTNSTVATSIEFSVNVDVTNRNQNLNNVWGVILIVLSLGLLAGVVYYFIKTSRATRFIDTPRAMKGKKEKVKAPKTEDPKVEAPKENAK